MWAVISRVTKICISINKSKPPQLVVFSTGEVPTTGWGTKGELLPWVYISPPADGILDFTFVGKSPTGIVNPVISPIEADTKIELPAWLKGVRVNASDGNSLTAMLDNPDCVVSGVEVKDGQVPWPWALEHQTSNLTAQSLTLGIEDDIRRELEQLHSDIRRWSRECNGDVECVVDRAISELKDRRCQQSNPIERGACNLLIEGARVFVKAYILGFLGA